MSQDDDFNRVFGQRREHPPIQGGFTERLMATAEAKGFVKPPPAATPAPVETVVGSGDYKPYGFLRDAAGEACDVRYWAPAGDTAEGLVFQYRFLLSIGYVGEEQLRLRLPDLVVEIEGQKLGELRRSLGRRAVSFIQQYSGRIWPRPPAGETVIDKVEVIRPELVRISG